MSGEDIEVRRCERGEAEAVLRLWSSTRSERASVPDRIDDVERLIGGSPAVLLVAEQAGEIVGTLVAAWDGWRGNMYRLAVRDDRRRRGIGTRLVRAGEDYLRGCGARRVTALVGLGDEGAEGLWEAAGYPLEPEMGRRVRDL